MNAVFISFTVEYQGKLTVFDGREENDKDLDLSDLELGEGLIYGCIIQLEDETYAFKEVLYNAVYLKKNRDSIKVSLNIIFFMK